MKPIHTTTEDCKECKLNKDYYSEKNQLTSTLGFDICQGKGKTTKLIFKQEDFEKLPKKGDVIEVETGLILLTPTLMQETRETAIKKKFRLTSDAAVKFSYELPELYRIKTPDKLVICEGLNIHKGSLV